VELRQDVSDLLSARRALRQCRRNRKTRYRAPRFDNRIRTKRKGRLAPSVENRINAHLSRIKTVLRLLPITKITVETASFDIQLLKNPNIAGKEYQEGEQLAFWNVREYVLFRDGHVCQHCHGRSKDPVLNVHHLESRRTGGDSPGNLITLCETCHRALHRGEMKLRAKRGQSLRAEAFMGIMRWEVLGRLKTSHPELEVNNTYGYRTKHVRIRNGIAKSHCADAFCIAGNLGAERLGEFFFQKQTRRNNRQIHKLSILKGGIRKRNQAPFEVKGFRLFDKVAYKGEEGFIFGRRSSGFFDVRKLDGTRISAGISCKKLHLLEKRQTYIKEIRKEEALPPLPDGRDLRA
ncbi:RNA-guided endonuclease IscB, partial [Parasutterella excrementihominis]|uniref:RNA-guided endonuclease IscB n=1 Tax=Parasutterella excrementihominis TaxID=487175 RepID=UPI002432C615